MDLVQTIAEVVGAVVAVGGVAFGLLRLVRWPRVKTVIDPDQRIRIRITNPTMGTKRQVVNVRLLVLRSRCFTRKWKRAGGDPPGPEWSVQTAEQPKLPIELDTGATEPIWLRIHGPVPLPAEDPKTAAFVTVLPKVRELRVAITYGNEKRVRRRLHAVKKPIMRDPA